VGLERVNIAIMRAFVELRRAASSYAAIEQQPEELERETRESSDGTTSN
jgi:hypothetical protein